MQGYGAELGKEHSYLVAPRSTKMGVTRHGSLLFLRPKVLDFNRQVFEEACNTFHYQYSGNVAPKHLVAPTFHPVYYRTDRWAIEGTTLVRMHKRARKTLFTPEATKDRPAAVTDLAG